MTLKNISDQKGHENIADTWLKNVFFSLWNIQDYIQILKNTMNMNNLNGLCRTGAQKSANIINNRFNRSSCGDTYDHRLDNVVSEALGAWGTWKDRWQHKTQ